jgi:hypothetical protein
LRAPDKLAGPAEEVAAAASDLADQVVRNTNLDQGVLLDSPDERGLAERSAAFRNEALKYFRG